MDDLVRGLIWTLGCSTSMAVLLSFSSVQAQVRPDRTTGTERIGNCAQQCDIRGGIQSDRNLFHSFEAFSIPRNGEVYFLQPNRIRNVFVRVTGDRASILDGFLFSQGQANLFLINPNGILFGNRAAISVGGSFAATTADAIAFEDLGTFDTRRLGNSDSPQLLSVDPSALWFHTTPAPITIQANADPFVPLQVFGTNTLLFVGGDIEIDHARLAAFGGGSIQGLSLGEPGKVDLALRSPFFEVSVPSDRARGDIAIRDSQINVRSSTLGEIRFTGRNIHLDSSALFAGIDLNLGFRGAIAGDIIVDATDTARIDGFSIIANNISEGATGNSGDVWVSGRRFELLGGSQIDTSTYGRGKAGSVIVEVSDRALFRGTTPDGNFASAILSNSSDFAVGNSGNITIRANDVRVLEGAQLSTATEAQGNAGNIRIDASDRVIFDGGSADQQYVSIAFSNVEFTALGNGGNIRINTRDVSVTNGASLVTSTDGVGNAGQIVIRAEHAVFSGTALAFANGEFFEVNSGIFNRVESFGIGDAGNIRIWADTLVVEDDARITSASLGTGNAGSIFIRATDSVGIDAGRIQTNSATNQSGRGGDITIESDRLSIVGPSQIISASEGIDRAGDIVLEARDITIDQGSVIAATLSQDGGNVTIANSELLLLRNNALLATAAGLDRDNGGGNGGNIAIAADLIVAVPTENSNITADAFDGNGGNVDIVTQGIFGIEFRDRATPFSDITASSEFGIDGEVTITSPTIDPTSSIVELPATPIDAANRLRRDCAAYRERSPQNPTQSEFIVTGRGGLPLSPQDSRGREGVQSPWAVPPEVSLPAGLEADREPTPAVTPSWVEAQAWQVNSAGHVVLMAERPVQFMLGAGCDF